VKARWQRSPHGDEGYTLAGRGAVWSRGWMAVDGGGWELGTYNTLAAAQRAVEGGGSPRVRVKSHTRRAPR